MEKFVRPVPIKVIEIPPVYPENPISWIVAAFSFIHQVISVRSEKISVTFDEEDGCFKVTDPDDMSYLWSSGFYGKGSLSRSEPTWLARSKERILGIKQQGTTGEEIVKYRRQLRSQYKAERNKLLELERKYRLENDTEKLKSLELQRQELSKKRDEISRARPSKEDDGKPHDMRSEDQELIIGDGELRNIEYLILTPCETFFLMYINSIEVAKPDGKGCYKVVELLKKELQRFGEAEPDNYFLTQFVPYFHYKALGWCVKPGLKFSSDYILYQRGPPFHHAAFAVTVLNNKSQQSLKDWTYFGSIYRVVSAVKKTMVLCYVNTPSKEQFHRVWDSLDEDNPHGLIDLLNLYTVQEIVYKRWTPSRTRI